jgi:hypothetical protein
MAINIQLWTSITSIRFDYFPIDFLLILLNLALRAWSGIRENELNAQQSFLKRVIANAAASKGEYNEMNISAEATKNLHPTAHDY